jgi:Zn-dependent peptidase ImmA (M78 family)
MDETDMEPVTISRAVLEWATDKAGLTPQSFAETIAKRDADRARIANGNLTPAQAAKLAKKARVPFGYLFLTEPPKVKRPSIPDLRQVQNPVPLSNDFYEVLEDVVAKQQWYAEYLHEVGAQEVSVVGRFNASASRKVALIVQDIRKVLKFDDQDRSKSQDVGAYFSKLSAKIEDARILVIKASYVKGATRRSLDEKEFRGFALSHPMAPIIFVNGRDAEVAALFTLMHELAHIWMGISGVSDITSKPNSNTERICNAVAGELLVPEVDFKTRWNGPDDLLHLAAHYRVSRLVIARRALDLGFVTQDFYDQVAKSSRPTRASGPIPPSIMIPLRNSKRFTKTVVSEAMNGHTMLRDAASLLNVRPSTVVTLAKGRFKNG